MAPARTGTMWPRCSGSAGPSDHAANEPSGRQRGAIGRFDLRWTSPPSMPTASEASQRRMVGSGQPAGLGCMVTSMEGTARRAPNPVLPAGGATGACEAVALAGAPSPKAYPWVLQHTPTSLATLPCECCAESAGATSSPSSPRLKPSCPTRLAHLCRPTTWRAGRKPSHVGGGRERVSKYLFFVIMPLGVWGYRVEPPWSEPRACFHFQREVVISDARRRC